MKILVTGSFGNVGESTVLALLEQNHQIRCFDKMTSHTKSIQRNLKPLGNIETVWGDIRSIESVNQAVKDVNCIIHLAAIIPPSSDINPQVTRDVNVGGTKNIIEAALAQKNPPKLVYASSIATYGHSRGEGPPKTALDPQVSTDVYSETKIECERLVKESGISWTILRFGVVPSLQESWLKAEMDSTIFEIPLEQRIEFVHTRDVGIAAANAVSENTNFKILLIGGGDNCRMTYREFLGTTLEAMGIGMLPDSAFISPKLLEDYFHTDWMDTREAQDLLDFQRRNLDDYANELRDDLGLKRYLIWLFKPIARRRMLAMSPYHQR
ncbi:MAG: NAD-dependent epimerase/dehydratase family protein [Candidatus Thorarchaeota archaeon]|jgi:nucleoside-diphosphate-sugar epimerase